MENICNLTVYRFGLLRKKLRERDETLGRNTWKGKVLSRASTYIIVKDK